MKALRGFASDNNSGIHPDILNALQNANTGHCMAYGDDDFTRRANRTVQKHFGDCEVFFVLTGTCANILGLSAAIDPYHAVVCADSAHIYTDECGAPERFTGSKLLPVHTVNGKINVKAITGQMHEIGFEHHVQPKIVSISQSTELGTVYQPEEIKEIADFVHKNNMYLHMDGARLANAAVSLDLSLKEITADCGVDILSFGGTKNGLMFAESVIFFNKELANNFKYIRKQGMQLASKMRYISVQFETYLENELWKSNALQANKMAKMLFNEVSGISKVNVVYPVESNAVFAMLPAHSIKKLQQEFFFYVWDEPSSVVRWMTSFDTTEEDISKFVEVIRNTV